MENFVVIATYSNQLEAEVAQATLAESEIESFLKFDDTAGMLPSLQFTKGVKLVVNQQDEQNARAALKDQPPEPSDL
jgi:hypothetical protein